VEPVNRIRGFFGLDGGFLLNSLRSDSSEAMKIDLSAINEA
jgi:hypothetical protein